MSTRIFVYGTLLAGESNHPLLAGARLLGAARTLPRYELRCLGGFPAMVSGGATAIEGEVYEVAPPALADLDHLEGHPDYYRRSPVALDDGGQAEAYLLPAAHASGCPLIDSGSWRVYQRQGSPAAQLDQAVADLYRVFSDYPQPATLEHCPCCVDDDEHRQLYRKPLRELTSTRLSTYAAKAITTWGREDEFKHFLPRIFELIARGQWREVNEEVVFGKLTSGRWRSWPEGEQHAVERYSRALWSAVLATPPASAPASAASLLAGFSRAFDDLTPFLKAWDAHPRLAASLHLVDLIEFSGTTLFTDLEDSFWRQPGAGQVAGWLRAPQQRARLERMIAEDLDEETLAHLDIALQTLG